MNVYNNILLINTKMALLLINWHSTYVYILFLIWSSHFKFSHNYTWVYILDIRFFYYILQSVKVQLELLINNI